MGRTGEAQDNAANDRLTDQQTQFYNEQNQAIQNYNTQLAAITAEGNPYTKPAYLQNEQSLINEATTASNKANAEGVENQVGRTGTNTASLQYTKAKMQHDSAQANAATLVGQRANDYQNANAWDQWLLGAQLGSAGAAGQGYGTATSGDSAALGNLTQLGLASYGPINSLIGAAGTAAAAGITASCPAEGSLYLMADGSEKRVEDLLVGDELMGIDDEPQTIEEIQSAVTSIIRMRTDDGFVTRNSVTHAFALPKGGFVVAVKSQGKSIVTKYGISRVRSVECAGKSRVFNVITDGSHTYRADGVWALGVGDAERYVSMEVWDKVGSELLQEATR